MTDPLHPLTSPEAAARNAQQLRLRIERAAWRRYGESAGLRRDANRLIKELEADVDAYAARNDLNKTDHMLLWDAARLLFLKWVGMERATAKAALATARILLEDHPI